MLHLCALMFSTIITGNIEPIVDNDELIEFIIDRVVYLVCCGNYSTFLYSLSWSSPVHFACDTLSSHIANG